MTCTVSKSYIHTIPGTGQDSTLDWNFMGSNFYGTSESDHTFLSSAVSVKQPPGPWKFTLRPR